jgi:hypothetical protein
MLPPHLSINRPALLLVFALALPFTARADDASLHAKAQELVTLLHTDRMVGQLSDNLKKRASDAAQRALGSDTTTDSQTKLADFQKKIADLIDTQISWTVLQPTFVDVYAKNFTEDELTSILAFYKSPAGAAFLEKTPTVNSQVTQMTQAKIAALQQQLNQAFVDLQKSMAPPAPSLGPAGTPAPATSRAPASAPK